MNPAAGVIPTQPTMIAVAAPIAVTRPPNTRSSTNQTSSVHAGVNSVFVNASTPGYRQKDLSVARFQKALRDRVEKSNREPVGTVGFDDIGAKVENPAAGILFHDGNNRSMEQLMTDQAKNAMIHNMTVELLRKQFQTMEMALRERVS